MYFFQQFLFSPKLSISGLLKLHFRNIQEQRVGVGQKLVQGRVQKSYGKPVGGHSFQNSIEVFSLHRQQFGQGQLPFLKTVRQIIS
jgi:hypothetical protein